MRVIAGAAKGRRLASPSGRSTRPTSDRVKESVFGILGDLVEGSCVLDLYAGAGSLGIEALSRGASNCVFVDHDRTACDAIRRNLDVLGMLSRGTIVRDDVERFIRRGALGRMYGIVFADPPYEMDSLSELLNLMNGTGILSERAVIVLEYSSRAGAIRSDGPLECVRQESYGDTRVSFHRLSSEG
ncbi:MAG: 16S rRNA (guanine(966)-N(2))-methyltransferase RsmD [Clostridia bacterium]|nr:16S rRNA (guanine(966)-N(2))-methyltransferase RsmD [Clostridia bacterium]